MQQKRLRLSKLLWYVMRKLYARMLSSMSNFNYFVILLVFIVTEINLIS